MNKKTSIILVLSLLLFSSAADSYVKKCPIELSACCATTDTLASDSVAYGTNCWEFAEGPYAWDANGFVCDATNNVQINPSQPCLVTCKNKPDGSCGCSLSSACVDGCEETVVGTCTRATFACSGASYSCAAGGSPSVECRDTLECQSACAKECGRTTTCGADCGPCCVANCNQGTYTQTQKDACIDACEGISKPNEEVCNVVKLLQLITVLVAVALIIINAIMWIISDDPDARTSARHGIWYVIVGLIVVAVAIAIVGAFTGVSILSCSLLS